MRRVKDWTEYTTLIDTLNKDEPVKAIYPVALTLPTEAGGRYAAAQIYDWTITNSRKPEMAINYFFCACGLVRWRSGEFRRNGQARGTEGRKGPRPTSA